MNTAAIYAARSFTLWHETAHLSLDIDGACLDPHAGATEAAEHWCDRTAGAVLAPLDQLGEFLSRSPQAAGLELVRAAARRFRVSLRAAAIALGQLDAEHAGLYAAVEQQAPLSDRADSNRGGGGMTRPQRRLRETGTLAARAVTEAVADGRMSERSARRLLRLDGTELAQLSAAVAIE